MAETNRFTVQFALMGTLLLLASVTLALGASAKFLETYRHSNNNNNDTDWQDHAKALFFMFIYGLMAFISLLTTAISASFFVLAFVPISRHHSMASAFLHFHILVLLRLVGSCAWKLCDKATKTPRQHQETLLKQMLKSNANTEVGRKWQFNLIADRDSYRRQVPLTTYDEDYKPYVDRLVEGEQNLLTKDLVEKFNVSSGTTGNCKLLPFPSIGFTRILWQFFLPYMYILNTLNSSEHDYKFLAPLKTAVLALTPLWRFTERTKIPIGPASSMAPAQQSRLISIGRTVPIEVGSVYMSEPSQLYLHWLFALLDPDLSRIDGTFAGALLFALELLQNNWQQLVNDVRHGRITVQPHTADIPDDLRKRLVDRGLIWPDPHRASAIEREFALGFEGIVKRLWPRIAVISVCCSGAHAVYVPRVRWFCGFNVLLYSPFYGASEGLFGMNMDPLMNNIDDDEPLYTLQPQMTFMEFIPEENITEEQPATLFIDQLEVGCRYEVVITSRFGFYRYRMGDLVQVVDHRYGKTPIVKFCSRIGSILDLRGEKTSEDIIFAALLKACPNFAGFNGLIDFTTTECTSFTKAIGEDGNNMIHQQQGLCYILFVELNGVLRQLTPSEVASFDHELSEISYPYKSFRFRGSIDRSKIFVVARGTFQRLKELALKRNQAISNQYKTPRYFSSAEQLRFLASSIVY